MNAQANLTTQSGCNISGDEKLVAEDETKKQDESSMNDKPDAFSILNGSRLMEGNIGKQDQQLTNSKMQSSAVEKVEENATDALRDVRIDNKEKNEALHPAEIPEANSSANESDSSTLKTQTDYSSAESTAPNVSASNVDSVASPIVHSISDSLPSPALASLSAKAIEDTPMATDVVTPLTNTVECIVEVVTPSSLNNIDNCRQMSTNDCIGEMSKNDCIGEMSNTNDISTAGMDKDGKVSTQITISMPNNINEPIINEKADSQSFATHSSNDFNMMTSEMKIVDTSRSTAITTATSDSPPKAIASTHNDDFAKIPAEKLIGNERTSTVNAGTNGSEPSSTSNMNSTSTKDVLPASEILTGCTCNANGIQPSEPNNCIAVSATDCTRTSVQLNVSIEDNKCNIPVAPNVSPIALPELAEHNQTYVKCEEVVPKLDSADGSTKLIDSPKPQSLDSTKTVTENIVKENMETVNSTPKTLSIKKQISHTVEKTKTPLAGKPSAGDHMTKKRRTEEKGLALNKSTNSNPAARSKQQMQKPASTAVQLKKPTGQVAKTTTTATKPSEKPKPAVKTTRSPGKTAGGNSGMHVKPSGKLSKPVSKTNKPGSKLGKPALASNIDDHLIPEGTQISNSVELMTSGDSSSIGVSLGVVLNCTTELCRKEMTENSGAIIATMQNEKSVPLMTSGDSSSIGISSGEVLNCSTEVCRKEMTENTDAIIAITKNENSDLTGGQQLSMEQHIEKTEAELMPSPPSSTAAIVPEVAAAQQGNGTSSALQCSESVVVKTVEAEEPTKITSDRQEESVNKLQTIMEVDKLSSIPEGTVLNTVSHEGSHPSESCNCEQTDSSLVMSNELITEVHDHENDQTQMQGTALRNAIQTEISSPQDSPSIEIGAEACKSEESNQYVVELTTSTSSPNEIEKMLVEEHNSCPDPMQTSIPAIVTATAVDIKEDTANELPSNFCGTKPNEDQKPKDTVSERHSRPTSVDADAKSKTCNIL
eukprot:Em0007g971a